MGGADEVNMDSGFLLLVICDGQPDGGIEAEEDDEQDDVFPVGAGVAQGIEMAAVEQHHRAAGPATECTPGVEKEKRNRAKKSAYEDQQQFSGQEAETVIPRQTPRLADRCNPEGKGGQGGRDPEEPPKGRRDDGSSPAAFGAGVFGGDVLEEVHCGETLNPKHQILNKSETQ